MGPTSDSSPVAQYPSPSDIALVAYSGDCNGCSNGGDMAVGGMAGGMMGPGVGMDPASWPTAQITFGRPEAMHVTYDATGAGQFDSQPLVLPARQNFPQGGLYRLKITNIPGREGVELYPTLEVAPATPRTGAYLAHNSIPVQFTEEDFDQVLSGNFVTKVIYLPDPEYQGQALAGIDTLVSTRLDPGVDPIVEADRRGTILAIIRLGDKDIEMGGQVAPLAGGMGAGGNVLINSGGILPTGMANMPGGCLGGSCAIGGCGPGGCNLGLCGPNGCLGPGQAMCPSNVPPGGLPGQVAGVTAPMYGMPITGTPIGLPGPPHIPLGVPAGLKRHVMHNHTKVHLPDPVETMKINVRMNPGYSYPQPVSRIHINETNNNPGLPHHQPKYDQHSMPADYCPPGMVQ